MPQVAHRLPTITACRPRDGETATPESTVTMRRKRGHTVLGKMLSEFDQSGKVFG